jgi:4-hydroxybenzoyl-CoA reductase subunit beta
MMRLPAFRLRRATSVTEAATILREEEGRTRLVAGGTDLWPNMKRRSQAADTVVSLLGVAALRGVERTDRGGLRIGALTTLSELAAHPDVRASHPVLARAAAAVASPVIQNTATLGGNLCLDTRCTYYNQNEEWRRSIDYCMKEAGTVCWVAPGSKRCLAVSASDTAPVLCALGARVRMVSADGERELPIADLYQDDGIAYLTKAPDEVLTEVQLDAPGRTEASFWKLRRRGSIDFGVLTTACAVERDDGGRVTAASIVLGALTSFPAPAEEAAHALVGAPLDADTIARAAHAARRAATPLDNTDFAPQWRGKMVERYVEAALREIAGLPRERLAPRHAL